MLAELERFLVARGDRVVPADQRLAIRVTDVDRAEEIEPLRGPADRLRYEKELLERWLFQEFGRAS